MEFNSQHFYLPTADSDPASYSIKRTPPKRELNKVYTNIDKKQTKNTKLNKFYTKIERKKKEKKSSGSCIINSVVGPDGQSGYTTLYFRY